MSLIKDDLGIYFAKRGALCISCSEHVYYPFVAWDCDTNMVFCIECAERISMGLLSDVFEEATGHEGHEKRHINALNWKRKKMLDVHRKQNQGEER